jgi:transcriptional regulator with XRE-family HTH domain
MTVKITRPPDHQPTWTPADIPAITSPDEAPRRRRGRPPKSAPPVPQLPDASSPPPPKRRKRRRNILIDGIDPIDLHVAQRVRERRINLGMSQSTLAEAIGSSWQQLQKNEKGTNRLSASRLWRVAAALDVPPSFFFDGLARTNPIPEISPDDDAIAEMAQALRHLPPDQRDAFSAFIHELGQPPRPSATSGPELPIAPRRAPRHSTISPGTQHYDEDSPSTPRVFFRAVLLDAAGRIIWVCDHKHRGPRRGLVQAQRCAAAELRRLARTIRP